MKILWTNTLEAHYGVRLGAEQASVWEYYLKEFDVGNGDLVKVIEDASKRGIMPRGYRVTVADLINWIQRSRIKWRNVRNHGKSNSSDPSMEDLINRGCEIC